MKKRHTPEQIVRRLREADELLSGGASIADACISLGVSEATYHRWRKRYGGVEVQALKKLKGLEKENVRLADKLEKAELIIDVQKKVARLLGTEQPEDRDGRK